MLTASVALAVAALALLSPLERKLRDQEIRTLVASAVQSRSSFRDLEARDLRPGSTALRRVIGRLSRETGARIALLDSNRNVLVDTDPDERDGFKDFGPALGTDRPIRRVVARGAAGEARVALRVRVGGQYDVLALRKPLDEQRSAVLTVRRAFLTAALAALAAALILATGFSATVLRRLRRLRDHVVAFDAAKPSPAPPADLHDDEVADLSAAFAEMRERLLKQEAIRRAFVATASHELRTPLMSLQGQLELLHDDLTSPSPDLEDAQRQLAGARGQADRLTRLATTLLDLSRLDAQLELREEPLELGELARAVAAEFEPRAQAGRSVELDLNGAAQATGDPGAVARVLRILLDNALRFAPEGSTVRVSATEREGGIALTVTDAGPGIAPEERERIFDRFARGRNASEDEDGGFGLGLAIGRELAQRMHGRLELERAEPGATAFTLWLPS